MMTKLLRSQTAHYTPADEGINHEGHEGARRKSTTIKAFVALGSFVVSDRRCSSDGLYRVVEERATDTQLVSDRRKPAGVGSATLALEWALVIVLASGGQH
jgi:hypothetical protein